MPASTMISLSYACHYNALRYRDILLLLLTEILKKIQFTYNQTELEQLDNEELNEDVMAVICAIILHC